MTTMTNTSAGEITRRAVLKASELGVPACIAVVDAGAHLVSFQRMDGAFLGAIDVAQRKARTSALFPLGSGDFGELIADQRLTGMEQSNGGLAAFHGGLPISKEDSLVGAIGVSGGTAEQDLEIARFALGQD